MRQTKLTLEKAIELKERMLASKDSREIGRCRAMLLSHKGYSINDLADIFEVDRDTITNWINRYEFEGISGLKDEPRSGRPPKLNYDQKKR